MDLALILLPHNQKLHSDNEGEKKSSEFRQFDVLCQLFTKRIMTDGYFGLGEVKYPFDSS